MNLTQFIRVLRKSEYTQAEDGSLTPSMEPRWETYARVRALRGSERSQAQQTEASTSYVFWTHRNDQISEDDVIEWGARQFNIRHIADEGPGSVYMMIEAETGVAV